MAILCPIDVRAEYASASQDGKRTIAGVVDTITLTPHANQLPGAHSLRLPRLYFVCVLTASLAFGLQHRFGIAMSHADGEVVIREADIGTLPLCQDSCRMTGAWSPVC